MPNITITGISDEILLRFRLLCTGMKKKQGEVFTMMVSDAWLKFGAEVIPDKEAIRRMKKVIKKV